MKILQSYKIGLTLKNNQTYLDRVENVDFCPFLRLHWTEVIFLLTELYMVSSGRVSYKYKYQL